MQMLVGRPFEGAMLERLKRFLEGCGLRYDAGIRFSAVLVENDEIIAAGSLDGATVKCIAVSPAHQGEDLTAQIVTCLLQEAAAQGISHLMLYTKPANQYIFRSFGFHPIVRTADCLLMENRRDGLEQYLRKLKRPLDNQKPVGCIVANCNPFTKGHRFLIETAAAQCAWLHLFVLSENKGMFSAEDRLSMVKAGCQDLANVLIHPSGPYMVSAATFPDYFIKDKSRVGQIHCEADVRLFGEKIAPALGIDRRYVGSEPNCAVTGDYNRQMRLLLPQYGVEVIEIPRKCVNGAAISATQVRTLILQGRLDALDALLPQSSIDYILKNKEN